ncbi:unnamed protein product [Peronospora belbahrii]|uniref:RING-type domain-containing protein n=1 Tax=Peronospora belbahrii TaxID=622444 RepID=A0ABN8CT24_9STRA|nr:unnamed protein product [Peronospora belbahrii]
MHVQGRNEDANKIRRYLEALTTQLNIEVQELQARRHYALEQLEGPSNQRRCNCEREEILLPPTQTTAEPKAESQFLRNASWQLKPTESKGSETNETLYMTDINEFFICKLCKGYYRDPYTAKECLHTFCHGCIRGFYLHTPSCTCPTCDVDLGAKPWIQFIPDPAMKELSEKYLPDYRAAEEREERLFYAKFGIKRKQPDTPCKNRQSASKLGRALGPSSPGHMIQFELHPQRSPDVPLFLLLGELKAPCMNTQSFFKVMYLRKYLAKKLNILKPEEIEILCNGTVVGPEYSLEFIRRTRWKDDSKMILEYRRQIVAS